MFKMLVILVSLGFANLSCVSFYGTNETSLNESNTSSFSSAFNPESASWKKLCVRDPSLPVVNQSYLDNVHYSISEVFEPWFEKTNDTRTLPFLEMLRSQHTHLVNGKSGRYDGATMIMHNMGTQTIPAGRYRFEIYNDDPDQRIPMSFQIERKLKEGLSERLDHLHEFYLSQKDELKDEEPGHEGADKIVHHWGRNSAVEVLSLPGIDSERVKVWNMIYGGWATHYYIRLGDTPVVLEAMGKALEKLRRLPRTREALLKNITRLEEYLYLGIHAHPFESGNFSLIMSQVNYILWRHGLSGISHGSLDFYGILEKFQDFQARFRDSVQKENASVALPKKRKSVKDKLELSILAHLSWTGDRYFSDKAVIEDRNDREHGVEGIKIMPPDLPEGIRLEYMAHIAEAGDTQWQEAGTYLGTSGDCQALEGLAMRLVGEHSERFEVYYQARLGVGAWTDIYKSGAYCGTKAESLPVTGIRVWLEQKK